MACVFCGQSGYDGAIDNFGDYICVDCWASGKARSSGRVAKIFVPADVPYQVETATPEIGDDGVPGRDDFGNYYIARIAI